ncbi:DUF805 domain-containing protein [Candidatus Woesebacteria bacterium]|nr:DUF805 domain-containing protein [Candidatus Woesebacteria bacterium]MBP7967269.1 DUF805 domain-containing protein [Candidatus Woesebacteria bacterium]
MRNFKGRLNRLDYIIGILGLIFVVGIPYILVVDRIRSFLFEDSVIGVLVSFAFLALIMTTLSLGMIFRRLHDLNKSGWYFLLTLIPVVGILIAIYIHLAKGTAGPNRFGAPVEYRTEIFKILFGSRTPDSALRGTTME